ncbi:MAG: sugar-binding domain-containing protein, partial [Bryobacteraceae bacterium]
MEKLNRTLRMALIGLAVAGVAAAAVDRWVPLAGEWRFALDPKDEGIAARWFGEELREFIRLPGTTDDNHKGALNEAVETQRLTRIYPYVGAAWYQRDIEVPRAWAGKRIVLLLERTKSSRLWVDGNAVGAQQDSLVAPHLYPLGALAPGRHRLTLRINNAELPPIGDPHQISDQTQTNWNGVIGKLGLTVTDPVWIDNIQVYPERGARKTRVHVEVGNMAGQPAVGTLTLNVASGRRASPPSEPVRVSFSSAGRAVVVRADYALEEGVLEWDEFSPTLYKLAVSLEGSTAGQTFRDQQETTFGLREFTAQGTQFHINGKTIFLRGTVDNCVFPLTGYPPMTVDGWVRVFRIAKSFGLNHYRFHTWCPPEAAFEAADQLGIYMQPELPNWSAFGQPEHDDFLRAEGERILRAFGSHPSFVMLSLGNELGGRQELMAPFVKHFRELDGRHLYAQGTNNWFPNVAAGDDYWATFQVGGRKVRGSYATVDAPLGHVQTGPPSTLKDYSAEIAGVAVPVVSHEIGEYQVASDFTEIGKYTGVLRARNLEAFRKRLEDRGLLNQAADFLQASGALSALCYREDIEAALRTRGFGGFQLLDLQDFPGQGTALVGMLNAFLESKGLIEPARWREFCSETVPLARLEKFTWTNSETLTAAVEVAHYGPAALTGASPAWALRDLRGRILASGRLPSLDIPQGTLTPLGQIRVPLARVAAPAKVRLELELRGTRFRNVYDVWVY